MMPGLAGLPLRVKVLPEAVCPSALFSLKTKVRVKHTRKDDAVKALHLTSQAGVQVLNPTERAQNEEILKGNMPEALYIVYDTVLEVIDTQGVRWS